MKRPQILSDASWNLATFALRTGGSLASLAWVARVLGPERQGRFGLAFWVISILGQVVVWGLPPAATRFVARALGAGHPAEARATVAQGTRWLLPAAALVLAPGMLLAAVFGGDMRWPLMLAVPASVLVGLGSWRAAVAQGLRRFDLVFWGDLLHLVLLLAGLGVALRTQEPIAAAVAAIGVARLGSLVLLWSWTGRLLRRLSPSLPEPSESLRGDLWTRSLELAALALLGAILWDRSEVAFLASRSGYEQLGFYTAAFGLSFPVLRVPTVLSSVMLPLVAGMSGEAERAQEIGAALRRGGRVLSLLVVGPVCVLFAAAPAIVRVLLDDEYAPAAGLLRILLLPSLVAGIGTVASQALVGGGRQGALFRITSFSASAKLWLCLALVPAWGATGAAIACSSAQVLGLALTGLAAGRRFAGAGGGAGSRWRRQAALGLVAGAATFAAGWLASGCGLGTDPSPALAVQVGAGAGAWGWALGRLRPLPAEDVAALRAALPPGAWSRAGRWLGVAGG